MTPNIYTKDELEQMNKEELIRQVLELFKRLNAKQKTEILKIIDRLTQR